MSAVLEVVEFLMRSAGDFLHVLSMLVLLVKMQRTKSCSGISLKAQLLYLAVFVLRYSDLVIYTALFPGRLFASVRLVYNSFMKMLFTSLQSFIIFVMTKRFYYSYDAEFDDAPAWMFFVAALTGGVFLTEGTRQREYRVVHSLVNWFYTSSVVLESVSIVPQLVLLQKAGEGESLTVHYVIFLGLYRVFYILGWIAKWLNSKDVSKILIWGSVAQTLLYSDLFIVYARSFVAKRKSFRIYPRMFIRDAFGWK